VQKVIKDAEIIAEYQFKLCETQRAHERTLSELEDLQERHEACSGLERKLQKALAQLEKITSERNWYFHKVQQLSLKNVKLSLRSMSAHKETFCANDDTKSTSTSCSESMISHTNLGKKHNRLHNYKKEDSKSSCHNNKPNGPVPDEDALLEFLYMTASAIKIKFADIPLSQDELAKFGRSVPFWKAHDLMRQVAMDAERKRADDNRNAYLLDNKEEELVDENELWSDEEDDHKIQNNVPIYHVSVLTNPRSFFNRVSMGMVDKFVHQFSE